MKVLIADNVPGLKEKLEDLVEFTEKLDEAETVIVRSKTKVNKDYCIAGKNIKLVIRAGVGLDNIDLIHCRDHDIEVRNTPEASPPAVSELVFAHMLAIARRIVESTNSMRVGKWKKKELRGFELNGKTLGIVGYGRIGREVAEKAKAFGMNIIVYDPFVEGEDVYHDLEKFLPLADIITFHIPLTEDTKGMIDSTAIAKMKDGVIIINAARGGIIKESDLVKALKSGKVSWAGLDVFENEPLKDSELQKLDNVVLTPHLGAQTYENSERISSLVADIIKEKVSK